VDYETASEEIKAGKEALDEVLTTPGWGMSAPGIDVSEGTLRAAADLGLEFVIGRTDATAPDDIAIFQPEEPYAATGILEGGTSPANTFEQLRDAATPGKIYILHPPHLENYGAMDEFEAFLRDIQPVSPSRLLQNPDEIGIVLDCTRPVKLL
jgi:peptidoglycan/xylan/chitin deacetylase (PgdA/CDA1 family)